MKKILITILIVFVVFIAFVFLIKGKIVAELYPKFGCGLSASTLGGSEICDCSGLGLSEFKIGGSRSICLGECSNCRCSFYNYTSNQTWWMECG